MKRGEIHEEKKGNNLYFSYYISDNYRLHIYMCEQKKVNEKSLNYDYEINTKEDDMSIDIDAEE